MKNDKYQEAVEEILNSREELKDKEIEYYIEAIESEREVQQDLRKANQEQQKIIKSHKKGKIAFIITSIICIISLAKTSDFKETLIFTILYYLYYVIIKLQEYQATNLLD